MNPTTSDAAVVGATQLQAIPQPCTESQRLVRVDMLRSLCVLCIAFLHFPLMSDATRLQQQGLDAWAIAGRDAFSNGFLYLALPTLALLSGFLAWGRDGQVPYGRLMQRKFWSLMVPMLIWNAVVLVLSFSAQSQGYATDVRLRLADADLRLVAEALFGFTRNPVNYPLHFLRDLFVLFALWPIWLFLVRRAPLAGLGLVAAVFLSNFDGDLVRRDTMAVTFYLGMLLASSHVWRDWLESQSRLAAVAVVGMVGLLVMLTLLPPGTAWAQWLATCAKVVTPLLMWSAAGLLQGARIGQALALGAAMSFPVFLLHAPLLQLAYRLLPADVRVTGLAHVMAWPLVTLIVIAVCIGLYRTLRARWPRATAVAFGGR